MKPEKAIEILADMHSEGHHYSPDDEREAVGLGREALHAYRKGQESGWFPPGYKLIGETEE